MAGVVELGAIGGKGRIASLRDGGDVSSWRLLGAHLPGGVSGASGDGGGGVAWAVGRSSPSTCGCRCRRGVRTCRSGVLARADIEGPATQRRLPFDTEGVDGPGGGACVANA